MKERKDDDRRENGGGGGARGDDEYGKTQRAGEIYHGNITRRAWGGRGVFFPGLLSVCLGPIGT